MEYSNSTSCTKSLGRALAGLSIFCLSVSLAHQAKAYLSASTPNKTQTAVRYYNPYEHDTYLIGVDKIVISATEPNAIEFHKYLEQHRLSKIDFTALDNKIVDALQKALPDSMKRLIRVESVFDTMGQSTPDDTVTINFTFGYRVQQVGDKQIVLGAVYPSIERPLPKDIQQDRLSGVLSTKITPVPFLIDGDGASVNQAAFQATERSISNVTEWLALFPLHIPEPIKDGK